MGFFYNSLINIFVQTEYQWVFFMLDIYVKQQHMKNTYIIQREKVRIIESS